MGFYTATPHLSTEEIKLFDILAQKHGTAWGKYVKHLVAAYDNPKSLEELLFPYPNLSTKFDIDRASKIILESWSKQFQITKAELVRLVILKAISDALATKEISISDLTSGKHKPFTKYTERRSYRKIVTT